MPLTHLEVALMYPGMRLPESAQRQPPAGTEVWTLEQDEGTTEAWFLPGRGLDAEHPGPLLVFAHGNNELIDHVARDFRLFHAAGLSVLLIEYRGYGRSQGWPGQAAIVADFDQAVDRACERPEVDPSRLVFAGHSLGTGVAAHLSATHAPAAVVLLSPFVSAARLAEDNGVPADLMRDRWESLAALREIDVPVWIAHGRSDRVVPVAHAREIAAGLGERAVLHEFAGGHDDPPAWVVLWPSVRPFLVESGVLPERGRP